MAMIKDYELVGELTSANSGFAKWGFAKKNGKDFFIKEFLSPVYPLDATVLSREQILHKRKICEEFYAEKSAFYNELDKCATGNIVTVIDFFRFGNRYYTVTEKIDAAKIDPMEIFRLGLDQKILIMKVILHCVNTLHQNHIVHCDIKPNNILFTISKKGKYTAKIIDFDSSFLETNPPKSDEEFQCDLVYLAPESFLFIAEEEGGILSTKIDVFALGVLFHQYLSGQLPAFDTSKYNYAFEAVLDGANLAINSMIPENIANIIAKMLDRNPENRPTVEEAFAMLNGGKSIVIPPPPPPPPPPPEDSNKKCSLKNTMRTTRDNSGPMVIIPIHTDEDMERSKPKPSRSDNPYFKKADDLL